MTETALVSAPRKKREWTFGAALDANFNFRFSSVSQVVMFDRTLEGGCERKLFYRYKLKIKEIKSEGQKKGSDWGERLEDYLTGRGDRLPEEMQRSKKFFPTPGPDLEVEEPLGDLTKAIAVREAILKLGGIDKAPQAYVEQLQIFAGLVADGVPFDGAADVRHFRGEYIDAEGLLRPEAVGTKVAEIDDHKAVKQIDSYWTRGNKNFIQGYAKSDADVCNHPQMVGYGAHIVYRRPEITHVRLAHIYTQTKGQHPTPAAKRGGLITASEVRARWQRMHGVMREMQRVVKLPRIEDVPFNVDACDTYVHVLPNGQYAKGCMHRAYCPLPTHIATANLMGKESNGMSFFNANPTAAPAVPVPANGAVASATPIETEAEKQAAWEAQVAREKALLLEREAARERSMAPQPPTAPPALDEARLACEKYATGELQYHEDVDRVAARMSDGSVKFRVPSTAEKSGYSLWQSLGAKRVAAPAVTPPPAPVVAPAGGPCRKCGVELTIENISKLPSGDIVHIGCTGGVAVAPPPPPNFAQINPPDAPKNLTLLDEADPMPAAEIAQIGDATARQRAEQHAQEHAARATTKAAEKSEGKPSPWCPGGDRSIVISTDEALERQHVCQCGKIFKFKPDKLTKDASGGRVLEIKNHKPVKGDEEEAAPQAPAVPVVAATAPAPAPTAAPVAPAPPPVQVAPVTPAPPVPVPVVTAPVPPAPPAPPVATVAPQGLPPLPPLPAREPEIPGLMIFVDVRAERGAPLIPLEDYYLRFVRGMEQLTGSRDVRTAEKSTPLAFGGWKGYLSAYCRAEPPAPGRYFARSSDEFAAVVIEAIGPRCEAIYRG